MFVPLEESSPCFFIEPLCEGTQIDLKFLGLFNRWSSSVLN